MGSDYMALPARDSPHEHSRQGSQSVHCRQLDFQLACRRGYADSAGRNPLAIVFGARVLVRGFLHRW